MTLVQTRLRRRSSTPCRAVDEVQERGDGNIEDNRAISEWVGKNRREDAHGWSERDRP
jgi:hypothetical protein